jgi:hypothetical protein
MPVEVDSQPCEIRHEGGAARWIDPAAALVDQENVAHFEPPENWGGRRAGTELLEGQIGDRTGFVREAPAADNR